LRSPDPHSSVHSFCRRAAAANHVDLRSRSHAYHAKSDWEYVRKQYYDPKFHGVNWDERLEEAKQQIEEERSVSMALSHIAAALDLIIMSDSKSLEHSGVIPDEVVLPAAADIAAGSDPCLHMRQKNWV